MMHFEEKCRNIFVTALVTNASQRKNLSIKTLFGRKFINEQKFGSYEYSMEISARQISFHINCIKPTILTWNKRNNYYEHRLVSSKKELNQKRKKFHRRFCCYFSKRVHWILLAVPKEPAEKAITLNSYII